jgi:hypothetical protein
VHLYFRASPLARVAALIGPFFVFLVAVFVNALRHSKSGELAGALGSLIGGMVGAGGAVWAVFLALSQQRREETAKVAEAVRTEITTLVKYAIGAVEICKRIKTGVIKVPRQGAHYIVKNFGGDPFIYPAVANRVGLLRHPHATAEFYMRIQEAKTMVEMLRTKTDVPGIMYTASPVEFVSSEFAGSVADSLLTALQLARPIVADEEMSVGKPQFTSWVQSVARLGHSVTPAHAVPSCTEIQRRQAARAAPPPPPSAWAGSSLGCPRTVTTSTDISTSASRPTRSPTARPTTISAARPRARKCPA